MERGEAILALFAYFNRTAQQMCHELLAIADAQHAGAATENGGVDGRTGGVVNPAGAARNNQPLGTGELRRGCFAGANLGINSQVAHFARNQMAILSAGVQDDYLGGGFHLAANMGRCGCIRSTTILWAVSSRAFALGMESMARSTSGSVSAATFRLSSRLKAVTYISRLRLRLLQSVFWANSASVNS